MIAALATGVECRSGARPMARSRCSDSTVKKVDRRSVMTLSSTKMPVAITPELRRSAVPSGP